MNGRVYDPVVGRFVSPDPWIQDPENSQSFNRYTYVWNNPLRYTDPTGEIVETVWDVANVGMGLASMASNIAEGSYGAAAVDAVGVVLDGAATALPIIPGGASTGIKAYRAGKAVKNAVKAKKAKKVSRKQQRKNSRQNKRNTTENLKANVKPKRTVRDTKKTNRRAKKNKPKGSDKKPAKGRNKVKPHPDAEGSHTTWKKDSETGEVTRHETYEPNAKNPSGFDKVQSTDVKGAPHINKKTGDSIPTPHTQGKNIPGGVRPATPDEIPKINSNGI